MNATKSPPLRSKSGLDEATLADIASDCCVSIEAIQDVYECSPLQVATMVESTMRTGTSTFQFVFALAPHVDEARFAVAVQHVVAQNAVLRTRIVDIPACGIMQVVLAEEHATRRPSDVTLDQYLRENQAEPTGMGLPLFATAIVERKLVLSMHHAVMDHAAITLLMTDVVAVYHRQLPVPRTPYKDFVTHCLSVDGSTANAFWASRFKGHPAIFPGIPSGRVPRATHTIWQNLVLNNNIADDAIPHISSFIEAALGLTLAAYSGSDSVAFGLVLAGRNTLSDPMSLTLGPTIATIPLQFNVQSTVTVGGVVKERTTARRQLQTNPALHAGLPRIRAASEAAGVASHFQTILNIRPSLVDADQASKEVTFDHMYEPSAPFGFCLSCNLKSNNREMLLEAHYDPVAMTERQVQNALHQFEHRLDSLMRANWDTRLKALPALNNHDRLQIMEWNRHLAPQVDQCLHNLFHAQAVQQPEATAVEAADGRATYGELDSMSTRVAVELKRRGVVRGNRVPFIFEKSMWTTVAMLAIMKAGAACVPIEPSDPLARRAVLIRSVDAAIVLTSTQQHDGSVRLANDVLALDAVSVEALPDPSDAHRDANAAVNTVATNAREDGVTGEDLAVILFTSGSTGTPKGVMLEHRCLASSLTALSTLLGWQPGRRVLQFAAHVWDISLGETFGALLFGGCLCVPSDEERSSALAQFIQTRDIDWAILTPTVLRTLDPGELPSLQTLVSAGEAIGGDIVAAWGGGSVHFINGWGPCETSVLSAVANVTATSPYPDSIGVPVGCAIWLVSPENANELVPIGSVGEIYVEGPGIARGYLGDVGNKTSTAFILSPAWAALRSCQATRFFRTGDLARYNPDGSISFIGRRDHQVKVRGQRFDLGELEASILGSDCAREAFATTKISAGRTEVVAVVGLSDNHLPSSVPLRELTGDAAELAAPSIAAIEAHTRSKLPSYMIPTVWIAVERMPRTTSAKLDRTLVRDWVKSLDVSTIKSHTNIAPRVLTSPVTVEEEALQTTWAAVLAIRPQDIGQESVFIRLGGDSVRAMQAMGLLKKRGYCTTTGALLSHKSLAAIAAATMSTLNSSTSPEERWDSETGPSITLPPSHISGMHVEHAVPATDAQATMLAVGQKRANGYHVDFTLAFDPGLDISRLQTACGIIIRHHPILRTVFVQYGSRLYQAILKYDTNLPPLIATEEAPELPAPTDFADDTPLARFHLLTDGRDCRRLRLNMHHALYDAFSLNLIFADLNAAYTGLPMSTGPQFHSWISHIEAQDLSPSYEFWKATLEHSSMSYLVPAPSGAVCGPALDSKIQFNAPLSADKRTSVGTSSSVVKAAWALLLSYSLQQDDVVFGEVSASRFDGLPGLEKVHGPCVNTVPVRAKFGTCASLVSLISQIHDLSQSSMAHHQVGFSMIIRRCTSWPPWTRFSSTLVYQTPGLLDNGFSIGDSKVTLSHNGRLGHSADLWIIVTPHGNKSEAKIELNFARCVFPVKQGEWIARCLTLILEALSTDPSQTLENVRDHLQREVGPFDVPMSPPMQVTNHSPPSSTSPEVRSVVDRAWEDVGLHETMNKKGGRGEDDLEDSMADCGGDIVTALLLSKYYSRQGYNASVEDIVRRPTRALQSSLLDGQEKDAG